MDRLFKQNGDRPLLRTTRVFHLFRYRTPHYGEPRPQTSTVLPNTQAVGAQLSDLSQSPAQGAVETTSSTVTEVLTTTKQANLGVIELTSGGPNPEIDIFFVHGLMGDACRTWEKNGVLWPKQLLGEAFPRARILTYGYDADVVKIFSRVDQGAIYQQSQSLIRAVHSVRRDHYIRPIIFIAHSLGGILVKDGLNWAKAQIGFSTVHVDEVFSATKGVIFLGTPHRGASGQYAELGEQLRRLVSITLHDSNTHLLSSLRSDSETLQRISEDFLRLCDNSSFLIFSFIETLPMTNIRGIGRVVDGNTGFMGLPREERGTIPCADHRGMARFSSRDDPGYQIVKDAVQYCIDVAMQGSTSQATPGIRVESAAADSHKLVLEFTANLQYLIDLRLLRSGRLAGSCEWLCKDLDFQSWISGPTNLLSLVGAAGSGKSHALSKAVDVLEGRFGKPHRGDNSTPLTAYYFRRASDQNQSLLNGMKSMIAQLAYLDRAHENELSTLWAQQQAFDEGSPTISTLWQNLLVNSESLRKRMCIFLVVDGLDEYKQDERREFLKTVCAHCVENQGPTVKIFFSGRPGVKADMTQVMDEQILPFDVPTIEISQKTSSDINMFIKEKMKRVKFKDKQLRTKVQNAISTDAKGMFLWVDLTLKEFIKAGTEKEVGECLTRMKRVQTLDDMYQDIVDSLTHSQVQILQDTLVWLIFGNGTLSWSLLRDAIERKAGTKIFVLAEEIERLGSMIEVSGFQRLRLSGSDPESSGIRGDWAPRYGGVSSPPLPRDLEEEDNDDIYFDDGAGIMDEDIVRIRHVTFQEWYLHGPGRNSPLWISPGAAQIDLAITCLDALVCCEDSKTKCPALLRYATRNWYEHLALVDWAQAPPAKLATYSTKLHTLFTDWTVTRPWLADTYYSVDIWSEIAQQKLASSVLDLMRKIATLDGTREAVRRWADEIRSSPGDVLWVMYDTIIRTAKNARFFDAVPEVSDMGDYDNIIGSMMRFFSSTSPSRRLSTMLDLPESEFWSHSGWAEHPHTKEYAIAGCYLTSGNMSIISRFETAMKSQFDMPSVSLRLSRLYFSPDDASWIAECPYQTKALTWVQKASQLCRERNVPRRSLGECLYLEARMHEALRDAPTALIRYKEAMGLSCAGALGAVAASYARTPGAENLSRWLDLYLDFKGDDGCSRPENTLANAILEGPFLHSWHNTFRRAATKCNRLPLLIKAYTIAIRISRDKGMARTIQCQCRFHLAKVFAVWPDHRAKAISLWTWVLNSLTWLPDRLLSYDQEFFCSVIKELSIFQGLYPLVAFVENIDFGITDYSRALILVGKGIEQQHLPRDDATRLYRRVLRRVLIMLGPMRMTEEIRMALGNALMALGDLDGAIRALSWPNSCPFTGKQLYRLPLLGRARCSWFSGECRTFQPYTQRYKCRVCVEINFCEQCYLIWKKGSARSDDSGEGRDEADLMHGLQYCDYRHEFVKVPPDNFTWSGFQEAESVRGWLEELTTKYNLRELD